MHNGRRICAIVPARNESLNIEHVVRGLGQLRIQSDQALIDEIVVCDNGSTDDTASLARRSGAKVVSEQTPGYGAACLRAVSSAAVSDVYLFVDGDDSIQYQEVFALLSAIEHGADLVIGARKPQLREAGAMSLPQRIGNLIAVNLIKRLWGQSFTDLGPFRAIGVPAYNRLSMQDQAFGWTVEMQVKAIQIGLVIEEVAVSCRRRRGRSKISGTVIGVINAARGILGTIFTLWWEEKSTPLSTRNDTSS